MELIILSMLVVFLMAFAYCALACEDVRKINREIIEKAARPKGWKTLLYYVLVPVCLISILAMLYGYYGRNGWFIAKRLILAAILLTVAAYDYREYRIPNKLLLAGLAMRAILLLTELLIVGRSALPTIASEFIGAVGATVICLVCMLIAKGSLGMGDLKLMTVMSFFLGIEGLCYSMIYSVFITFICSVVLLLSRRKGHKDSIPFAPFILLGTWVSIILSGT